MKRFGEPEKSISFMDGVNRFPRYPVNTYHEGHGMESTPSHRRHGNGLPTGEAAPVHRLRGGGVAEMHRMRGGGRDRKPPIRKEHPRHVSETCTRGAESSLTCEVMSAFSRGYKSPPPNMYAVHPYGSPGEIRTPVAGVRLAAHPALRCSRSRAQHPWPLDDRAVMIGL